MLSSRRNFFPHVGSMLEPLIAAQEMESRAHDFFDAFGEAAAALLQRPVTASIPNLELTCRSTCRVLLLIGRLLDHEWHLCRTMSYPKRAAVLAQ